MVHIVAEKSVLGSRLWALGSMAGIRRESGPEKEQQKLLTAEIAEDGAERAQKISVFLLGLISRAQSLKPKA
jgi:hypothetical protein